MVQAWLIDGERHWVTVCKCRRKTCGTVSLFDAVDGELLAKVDTSE